MTSAEAGQPLKSQTAAQMATRMIFLVAGIGMSTGAAGALRERSSGRQRRGAGRSAAVPGAGSLIAMPLTGALVGKQGCKRIILTSSALLLVLLPLMATLSSPVMLAIALMLFGAAIGTLDVAMNIQAVEVEKASERTMMSGFHGFTA